MKTIPDISRYQKVDWAKFRPEVLIVKATEATSYADPTLNKNVQEARKRNVPIGAYHFARGGDAKKEAEWFLKNASDLDFLVCDWEIPHKDPVGWCKAFCDRLSQAGKPVLLYMNDSTALRHDWMPCAKYPFWVARYKYPGGDPRDNGKPDEKYSPKSKWLLWQFTSNGKMDGIEGRVDLNQARDEFFEFIKQNPMPEPANKTLLSQRDPRWAADYLGKSKSTVGRYGCTITSISMGTGYFNVWKSPKELAKELSFTSEGLLLWNSLPNVTAFKLETRFFGQRDDLIRGALAHPKKICLIQVENYHWVLATGRNIFGGYRINDPWTGRKGSTKDYKSITGGAVLVFK